MKAMFAANAALVAVSACGQLQPVAAARTQAQKFIGRRPIAAFGNSDGDLQMLQWTAAGPGRRLMVLVDHTDAGREFDYRISPMGRLEMALDEARRRGWTVVSMKDDWRRVFSFK